ncbi:hypothetical protein BEQ56_02120 [Anaerolineaceae bacterium oral taxon 439]|nr:hypothetical protein BEQ56_02120 [Anaerolineaceae bacterium oral taxon 439]
MNGAVFFRPSRSIFRKAFLTVRFRISLISGRSGVTDPQNGSQSGKILSDRQDPIDHSGGDRGTGAVPRLEAASAEREKYRQHVQ